ncbi:MAG: PD40 domain-containing protein [Chloroflexia bacterium]|nr:PD40 domain-containing protein [Chloroflexia bacterium]
MAMPRETVSHTFRPANFNVLEATLVTKSLVPAAAVAKTQSISGADALAPEEIADRLIPTDPRISPDGSRVVFVARPASKKGEHWTRALWIASEDAAARQLTAGNADDQNPHWSPDGRTILFRSNCHSPGEDKQRLYLLSVSGGEALPLGEFSGDLGQAEWSPDGRSIAVLQKDPEPEDV